MDKAKIQIHRTQNVHVKSNALGFAFVCADALLMCLLVMSLNLFFSDACFSRVLWSRCVFLMSLMLLQSGKSCASESYAASQSSVCGSYGILRRLAMSDSLGSSVRYIQSRSSQAPFVTTPL